VASPRYQNCPWCKEEIVDWFTEWYPRDQYDEIEAGTLAMDCPSPDCRRPVFLNKAKLSPVPQGQDPTDQNVLKWVLATFHPAIRSVEKATDWATGPGAYPSLEAFLTDPTQQPRAEYFCSGYWPQINV
jgi:hypothetical protein